jgi:uncharacterized Zn finger protein
MPIASYTKNLCTAFNKNSQLTCRHEDLEFLKDLGTITDPGTGKERKIILLACRTCGQVYRESTTEYNHTPYRTYDKIKGQRIDDACHCIGYLEEVKILFEERLCEGDPQWFTWKKETLMKCQKCGALYKELIIQDNYDGFYSCKYVEASES